MFDERHREAHIWLSDNSSKIYDSTGESGSPGGTSVAFGFSLVAMLLLTALILVSNLMVVVAVLSSAQLRKTWNNCFILNLCLTQVIAALLVLPLSIAFFVEHPKEISPGVCLFAQFLHASIVNVVCWTVCLISIDRLLITKLRNPTTVRHGDRRECLLVWMGLYTLLYLITHRHYFIMTPMIHGVEVTLFRALMAVLVVWIVSVVPSGYLLISQENGYGSTVCCGWGLGISSSSAGYALTVLILEFTLPAVTMFSMYASIYRFALRTMKRSAKFPIPTISGQIAVEGDESLPVHQQFGESQEKLEAGEISSCTPKQGAISLERNEISQIIVCKQTPFKNIREQIELQNLGNNPSSIPSAKQMMTKRESSAKEVLLESAWDSVSWVIGSQTSTTFIMTSASNQSAFIHQATKMGPMPIPRNEKSRRLAGKKAARTLLLVVGTFWVCCLPYFVFNAYFSLVHYNSNIYRGNVEERIALIREAMEMNGIGQHYEDSRLTENSLKSTLNSSRFCTASLRMKVGERNAPYVRITAYIMEWLLYCAFAVNPFLYGLLDRTIRTQLNTMVRGTWLSFLQCGRRSKKVEPSPLQDIEAEEDVALGPPSLENILEFLQKTNYSEDQMESSSGRFRW